MLKTFSLLIASGSCLLAATQPIYRGGITDAELRKNPLPVSVTEFLESVSIDNFPATQTVSGSVNIGNWPGSQAVTIASLPLPAGASTEATLALIKAKTDNLDVALSTRTKPADTQPVSIASMPTTPVTGVFYQSTQPVSLATNTPDVTDRSGRLLGHVTVDSAPSTAVTGTFWQVTQPVSGTLSISNFPGTQAVSGTFWQATQPVSGTFWQATQPVSGTVAATQSGAWTMQPGNTANTTPWIVELSQSGTKNDVDITSITPPTLTKGTQGATGFSVQALKDAGRTQVMLAWEEMAGTAAAESALTNFTFCTKGAATQSATNNYTVTSGKTLHIQTVTIYVKTTGTANNLSRFRIRQAASSIANNSPVIWDKVLALSQNGTYLAGEVQTLVCPLPDGLEVASSQQVTFTWFTAANTCTVGMSIDAYEY